MGPPRRRAPGPRRGSCCRSRFGRGRSGQRPGRWSASCAWLPPRQRFGPPTRSTSNNLLDTLPALRAQGAHDPDTALARCPAADYTVGRPLTRHRPEDIAMRRLVLATLATTLLTLPALAQEKPARGPLLTRWAKDVSADKVLPEYPRPQMQRSAWLNLNGHWQFAVAGADDTVPLGK